ncbi:MAG: phosphodiesterase [Paracoccaceae bacterium]
MIIAQLTDLHIFVDQSMDRKAALRVSNLKTAIQQLNTMTPRPDIVLFTGDLADTGNPEEYTLVKKCLDVLRIPFVAIPGNHDNSDNLKTVFAGSDGSFDYVIDDFPLRLIGINSAVAGEIHGRVSAAQRHWLDDQLSAQPTRPTLIFMHHPPMNTGIHGLDKYPFSEARALEDVIGKHAQVAAILCGHVHRTMIKKFGGSVLITCPSTAYQFDCNLAEGIPLATIHEPCGYFLHTWSPDNGLLTHTRFIDDFGAATPLAS